MKTKLFLLSIFLLANSFLAISQIPNIEWENCYGGGNDDQANCVIQTLDGGYAVAGISSSTDGDATSNHGLSDYWIIKLKSNDSLEWQKSFGGSKIDIANSIIQTSDGGFAVAGVSGSNDGDITNHHGGNTMYGDVWIVKLGNEGNLQWQKSYGGTEDDGANSIIETSDNGYAVAGFSSSINGDVSGNHGDNDYWILKLDSNGNILWQKCLGGSGIDGAFSIIQTADNGYVAAGQSASNDGDVTGHHGLANEEDYWLVKLDSEGSLQWERSFGGSAADLAYSVIQGSDGNYVVAGSTQSYDGDVTGKHNKADYWIVKLSSTGSLIWEKSLGGFENENANSIAVSNDGGYIVAGETASDDGDVSGNHQANYFTYDYWILKLDESGNLIWQECLGGDDNDNAYSIANCSDGGFVIAGYANSFGGDVTGNHGYPDFWVVKLSPEITGISNQNFIPAITVSPNPSTGVFEIQNQSSEIENVIAFNLLGEKVFETNNLHSNTVDFTSQPDGVYFLHLKTKEGWAVKKVVMSR